MIDETDEFARWSWHDCHVWGFHLRTGDPAAGDWTSELVLDIDYIVEWICDDVGKATFRVAPATLTFHDVTDLRISIDWRLDGYPSAVHPASIAEIHRARGSDPGRAQGAPNWLWTIALNWPADGRLEFAAGGFTQTLRSEPTLTDEQVLPYAARPPLS